MFFRTPIHAVISRLRVGLAVSLVALSPALAGAQLAAPSGHKMSFDGVSIVDSGDAISAHFLFLWPEISGVDLQAEMQMTETDTHFFCQHFAVPYLTVSGVMAAQVGISFSDRPVTFGIATPDAIQVFESYRLQAGICEWEAF